MILLTPQALTTNGLILHSFEVVKSARSMDYITSEISAAEIRRKFKSQPSPVRDTLRMFSTEGLSALKSKHAALHAKQRSGISFETYYHTAFLRELHGYIYMVRPFLEKAKCYHRIKNASGNVKTSPCRFQPVKPALNFEVSRTGNQLSIVTRITIGDYTCNPDELNRHHFLIEKNGDYYLLGYKDYQILEWLESDQVREAGRDEVLFRKVVLGKLEENHRVQYNDLLDNTTITSPPQGQVLVSELNDSFLMLTPQWLYEGFLIEGPFKENVRIFQNSELYFVRRDHAAEQSLVDLLKDLHPTFEKLRNGYFYLTFDDAKRRNWFLNSYHKLLDLGIRVTGMDLMKHFRFSEFKPETELEINPGDNENELRLTVTIRFGKENIPLLKLQRILLAEQHTVLLSDDCVGVLDEDWQKKYVSIFKHGRIKDNEIRIERWIAISEQLETENTRPLTPSLNNDWWELWNRWQANEDILFDLPAALNIRQLRPYQQRGFEWITILARAGAGACLADDMGLGKTLQTICFLAHRLEQYPGTKHLVICPASLIYNWKQEFEKFAPSLRIMTYHGISRSTSDLRSDSYDVVITSSGTLRSDIAVFEEMAFCVVALDESHQIKNPSALITRAVSRLRALTRIALSGTPVMNNTFDLYAQLNFVLPGMFGSREFFKRTYADPIDRDHDPVKIKQLQKLTAPFILRRTKEQAAPDLPEKTEMILWCDMGITQTEQYDEIRNKIRASIFLNIEREGLQRSKLSIIQGITRLRQVCNSPLLLPNEDRICDDSVKTEVLIDELRNNLKDHKVLVFSQFSSMLNLIAADLKKNHIDFFHFDGQTPPHKRMEMVNSFQQEGNPTNVFLISLMAGNTGLNLTAADYVILFDPWWNTAVQQQAIDRTHRIGQTKKVFAYKMICRDTIEEKIIELQKRKKSLSDNLIGEEEGFVKNLTMEDLEYLLN